MRGKVQRTMARARGGAPSAPVAPAAQRAAATIQRFFRGHRARGNLVQRVLEASRRDGETAI